MNLDVLAPTLLAYAWKGALILVVAAVAERLLFRATAALRHGVWTLALAALVLVPIAATVAPEVSISVPAVVPKVPVVETAAIQARPTSTPAAAPPRAEQKTVPAAPVPAMPVERVATPVATPPAAPRAATPAPAPHSFQAGLPSISAVLISLWALGAAFCLGHYCLGLALLIRMRNRTTVATDDAMGAALEEARRAIGMARPVTLRIGGAAVPMTWGYFRPTVMVPDTAAAWPETKLRVVLLHELAHAKRGDFVTHGLARVAASLHWFNPIAWYGLHRMLRLREVACDDAVLRHGAVPVEYADHLMDVVRALRGRRPGPAAAIAMARSPRIESRLRAILNAAANRAPVTRRTVVVASAVAIVGLTLASGLRVVRAEDRWVAHVRSEEGLELVAVGDLSIDPPTWWKPDHTPIPPSQMALLSDYLIASRRSGPDVRALLFRPVGTERSSDELLREYDLTLGDAFPCNARFVWNKGDDYDGCLVFTGTLETDAAHIDATVTTNAASWKMILERDGWGGQSMTVGEGEEITFMGTEIPNWGLSATVTQNAYADVELRAILTDESGLEHIAYPSETLGTQARLESFLWPDLRLGDIAGFRVEMRSRDSELEHGRIRGVPLTPPDAPARRVLAPKNRQYWFPTVTARRDAGIPDRVEQLSDAGLHPSLWIEGEGVLLPARDLAEGKEWTGLFVSRGFLGLEWDLPALQAPVDRVVLSLPLKFDARPLPRARLHYSVRLTTPEALRDEQFPPKPVHPALEADLVATVPVTDLERPLLIDVTSAVNQRIEESAGHLALAITVGVGEELAPPTSPFAVQLPSGTVMELLAIGDPSTTPTTWWDPAGNPTDGSPFDGRADLDAPTDGSRLFAFRREFWNEPGSTHIKIGPETFPANRIASQYFPVEARPDDGIYVYGHTWETLPDFAEFEMEVVEGPWHTILRIDEPFGSSSGVGGVEELGWSVVWDDATVRDDPGAPIQVNLTTRGLNAFASRAIAVDHLGFGYPMERTAGTGNGEMMLSGFTLRDRPAREFATVAIQYGPIDSAHFREIPLHPGTNGTTRVDRSRSPENWPRPIQSPAETLLSEPQLVRPWDGIPIKSEEAVGAHAVRETVLIASEDSAHPTASGGGFGGPADAGYGKTYASGTEVELVAIGNPLTEPITWWGPDGKPVEAPDVDLTELASQWAEVTEEQRVRIVVMRKQYGEAGVHKDLTWPTGNVASYGGPAFHPHGRDGRMAQGLLAGVAVFFDRPATTDIEVRIVEGPWVPYGETEGLNSIAKGSDLIVHAPGAGPASEEITVVVTDRLPAFVRPYLEAGAGRRIDPAGVTITDAGGDGERLRTGTYRFENVAGADVTKTAVETSPYRGIIFAGVPLEPDGEAATVTTWRGDFEPEPETDTIIAPQ